MTFSSGKPGGAVALGRQITIEYYDCSAEILADVRRMERIFLEAAEVSGAHVVNSNFHSFEPQGVSGVVVISESHFAVHAWPEHDYAAVDLFTCGSGVDFDAAVKFLAESMNSGRWIISSLANRGILHDETGTVERLVPVVENGSNCGLQLSWKDRFDHSGARALSCCIDLYDCAVGDFSDERSWEVFSGALLDILHLPDASGNSWFIIPRGQGDIEFFRGFKRGRIAGLVSAEKNQVYLDIFSDGFFDPRPVAEEAMKLLSGKYYRLQVQIRQ